MFNIPNEAVHRIAQKPAPLEATSYFFPLLSSRVPWIIRVAPDAIRGSSNKQWAFVRLLGLLHTIFLFEHLLFFHISAQKVWKIILTFTIRYGFHTQTRVCAYLRTYGIKYWPKMQIFLKLKNTQVLFTHVCIGTLQLTGCILAKKKQAVLSCSVQEALEKWH